MTIVDSFRTLLDVFSRFTRADRFKRRPVRQRTVFVSWWNPDSTEVLNICQTSETPYKSIAIFRVFYTVNIRKYMLKHHVKIVNLVSKIVF